MSEPPAEPPSSTAGRRSVPRVVLPGVLAVLIVGGILAVQAATSPSTSPTAGASSSTPPAVAGPTPSETPMPTPTGPPVFAGTVTVDPRLPSAQPVTPEVWAQAGPGWALVSYREMVDDQAGPPPGPQVVYLVSPDGVRYQLTEVPGDRVVQVVAWQPGWGTARALSSPTTSWREPGWDGAATWVRLDLGSGATTPLDVTASPPRAWFEPGVPYARGFVQIDRAMSVNGDESSAWAPSERPAVAAAVAASYPDHTRCGAPVAKDSRWWIIACERDVDGTDPSQRAPMVLQVRDDGGAVVVLATPTPADGPAPTLDVALVRGVVVVPGSPDWTSTGCPTQMYRLDAGRLTPLPGVAATSRPSPFRVALAGVSGASVYTRTMGCGDDRQPQTLVRDDLSSGASAELVPFPADGAGLDESVTGAYVAP